MPLDGHSYLVSQGWGGKGTGLREGAVSRPLAISQKKNLAGLGKDRDEAFPFWDHLFSAAAKSIVVKCLSDDEDMTESSPSKEVTINRTSTGIFSTRRPLEGTPVTSGTPDDSSAEYGLSLLATAKRDAARRGLYSRFFKGPVLGPESIVEEEKRLAALVSEAFAKQSPGIDSIKVTESIEIQTATERVSVNLEVSKSSHQKRKSKAVEESESEEEESEIARRERKRKRKEQRRARKGTKDSAKDSEEKKSKSSKSKSKRDNKVEESGPSRSTRQLKDSDQEEASKAERKHRREEKKRLKASSASEEGIVADTVQNEEKSHRSKSKSKDEKKGRPKEVGETVGAKVVNTVDNKSEEKRKKKKRKRSHGADED